MRKSKASQRAEFEPIFQKALPFFITVLQVVAFENLVVR